jgi:hypothetical protein
LHDLSQTRLEERGVVAAERTGKEMDLELPGSRSAVFATGTNPHEPTWKTSIVDRLKVLLIEKELHDTSGICK